MNRPLTTITNPIGLASVMDMLRSGRFVTPHECTSRGKMELHFANGQSIGLGFHPGHHFLRCEFSARGSMFWVSRSWFLGTLKAAGVDTREIPTR